MNTSAQGVVDLGSWGLMLFQGDLRQSTIQRTACRDIMRHAEPEAGCNMQNVCHSDRYRVEMIKDWNNMASCQKTRCLNDLVQEPPPMTVQEKRQARANSLKSVMFVFSTSFSMHSAGILSENLRSNQRC